MDIKGKLSGTEDLGQVFGKIGDVTGVDFTKDFSDLKLDVNDATNVKEMV
jgi:hypothetical protein